MSFNFNSGAGTNLVSQHYTACVRQEEGKKINQKCSSTKNMHCMLKMYFRNVTGFCSIDWSESMGFTSPADAFNLGVASATAIAAVVSY